MRVLLRLHVTQKEKALQVPELFFPPSRWCFRNGLTKSFFANVSSFVTQEARDQDWTCQCEMSRAFKPFLLKINSNSGFKREHVESCSSTTKNITSRPLPQCLWPANLAG